jgi:hypothetical protein
MMEAFCDNIADMFLDINRDLKSELMEVMYNLVTKPGMGYNKA